MKRFKLNLGLKYKLLVFILPMSVILYISMYFILLANTKQAAKKEALRMAETKAEQIISIPQQQVSNALHVAKTLATTLEALLNEETRSRKTVNQILQNVLNKNPKMLSAFTVWEPNSFDGNDSLFRDAKGHDYTGRLVYTWHRGSGKTGLDNCLDYEAEGIGDYYLVPKRNLTAYISEPTYYKYEEGAVKSAGSKYIVRITFPVVHNNGFVGVAGVDIDLMQMTDLNSDDIHAYDNSVSILSEELKYIAHPNPLQLGEEFKVIGKRDLNFELEQLMMTSRTKQVIERSFESDEQLIVTYKPFDFEGFSMKWLLCYRTPLRANIEKAQTGFGIALLFILVGIAILSVVVYLIAQYIASPIVSVTNSLKEIAEKGDLSEENKVSLETGDELEFMSDALNGVIDNLRETAGFAKNVGIGDTGNTIKPLSENDLLRNTLTDMQERIREAKEIQKKREFEEARQNKVNTGLAKFGDILQETYNDQADFYYNIIKNLVSFIEVEMGGIFILNDENKDHKFLELLGTFAYDRQKYLKMKTEIGEGLVGACVVEKKTMYLSNIPEDYIQISSGFGSVKPKYLLIVPLKIENNVFGVVEIGSLNPIAKYIIEFVEEVSENIATTISTVKANTNTRKLLEESREQAEQMAAQEEEMRQNMEELIATQESADRREAEVKSIFDNLNSVCYVAEFDVEGRFMKVNDKLVEIYGLEKESLIGEHYKTVLGVNNKDAFFDGFEEFWDEVLSGSIKHKVFHATLGKAGMPFWISQTFSPVIDTYGATIKVLLIGFDVTESKLKEKENESLLEETVNQAMELSAKQQEAEDLLAKLKEKEASLKVKIEEGMKTKEELSEKLKETKRQNLDLGSLVKEKDIIISDLKQKVIDLKNKK